MTEENFFDNIGREMLYHKFAEEKLDSSERKALNSFYKRYGEVVDNLDITSEQEGELVASLLDEISGAREAFEKFNRIVESMEKTDKGYRKYESN